MGTPNWGKLYQQGRCKAIGVSWNEEELNALYVLKIPVEYVREDVITVEEYEKRLEQHGGKKPLEYLSLAELREKAIELEVDFSPLVARETLLHGIIKKLEKIDEAKKAKPKPKPKVKVKTVTKKTVAKKPKASKSKKGNKK